MVDNTDTTDFLNSLKLSENASPYILLQRIDTQRWNPSNILPEHKRPFDGLYKNFLLQLESSFRHDQICQQYLRQIETDFSELEPFMTGDVSNILDIGCGMAGIDLLMWDYFKSQSPDIYLFDKSEVSDDLYYEFYDNPAFYNSLETARNNLIKNNVPDECVHTVEATPENLMDLNSIDLSISLYSWGFHYPVETYLDEILNVLNPEGRIILDIRKETGDVTKNTNDFELCERRFRTHEIIKEEYKFNRVMFSEPIRTRTQGNEDKESDDATEPELAPASVT